MITPLIILGNKSSVLAIPWILRGIEQTSNANDNPMMLEIRVIVKVDLIEKSIAVQYSRSLRKICLKFANPTNVFTEEMPFQRMKLIYRAYRKGMITIGMKHRSIGAMKTIWLSAFSRRIVFRILHGPPCAMLQVSGNRVDARTDNIYNLVDYFYFSLNNNDYD